MREAGNSSKFFDMPMLSALDYAASAWPVAPCHVVLPCSGGCTCGEERCATPGAHTFLPQENAGWTTKESVVRYLWGYWPRANVAIQTGEPSGLLVLDVDPTRGGLDSLREVVADFGPLPATFTVDTGSGGLNYYFLLSATELRHDLHECLGSGLKMHGDDDYVLAPPSFDAAGRRYSVMSNAPVSPVPEWMLETVVETAPVATPAPVVPILAVPA